LVVAYPRESAHHAPIFSLLQILKDNPCKRVFSDQLRGSIFNPVLLIFDSIVTGPIDTQQSL